MGAVLVLVVEVVDGVAVGQNDGVVAPFVAKDFLQQTVACAARNALVAVVGAHKLTNVAFGHKFLEGRQISFPQVAH